jgi:hypothetical protein
MNRGNNKQGSNYESADVSWRRGPVELWKGPSAQSASRASLTKCALSHTTVVWTRASPRPVLRYTAFGLPAQHVIQNPSNRRYFQELQGRGAMRIREDRLRELSSTSLQLKIQARIKESTSAVLSVGSLDADVAGAAVTVTLPRRHQPRRRTQLAMPRRNRIPPTDVEPEVVNQLASVLECAGLPVVYASALASNGFGTVGALVRRGSQLLAPYIHPPTQLATQYVGCTHMQQCPCALAAI